MKHTKTDHILFIYSTLLLLFIATSCKVEQKIKEGVVLHVSPYLNHHDSAHYVGMQPCLECHYPIYQSYMRTGMGRSFGKATPAKSDAIIGADSMVYDPHNNMYYHPFWKDSTLFLKEFRIENDDTVHQRTERVEYIIGSGNHTNSHIYSINGYLHQIPFTFYTQQQLLDLPPGYEGGNNSRFGRSLGLECISCHNGLPDLVPGSENKYVHVPEGIDCERCHGPGSIHVGLKKRGILVDTAKYIDYSIVNPGRLSKSLQNDVCARCHLQGTIVLKQGKSFYDYLPGMALDEVMDIFMPVFEGGKEDLIMASHVERLMDSRCFNESKGDISCIDCHNPHFSIKETARETYSNACLNCHSSSSQTTCSVTLNERLTKNNDCAACHMPKRDSRDIPHVIITDHKIIKPQHKPLGERVFKGLKALNNPAADALTKAKGYLREYETYQPNPIYLDSAAKFLKPSHSKTDAETFKALVQYFFLSGQHASILKLLNNHNKEEILNHWLTNVQFDNADAWTAYRIGQAYENTERLEESLIFYSKAIELAPYQLDFLNKYGSILVALNQIKEAKRVFARIINENPRNDMAWVNLGYCETLLQNPQQSYQSYLQALRINPDNFQALLNLASYHASTGTSGLAKPYLMRALRIQPDHLQAKQLLNAIETR